MENGALPADLPEEFLNALVDRLSGFDDVDMGLVEILKKHILTVSPAQNAVVNAKDDILKLAAERANPPQPGV